MLPRSQGMPKFTEIEGFLAAILCEVGSLINLRDIDADPFVRSFFQSLGYGEPSTIMRIIDIF